MSSHRNSATYAFTEFINATGWESQGIVFILGMVTAAFSM
jgi:choline transport protein